ncbi:MAG: hypothetical protein V4436_01990 [Patescibacteria group bacterium]
MATDEELKALLGEDTEPTPPAEETKEPEKEPEKAPEEDPEVKAKNEQLANLNKAVKEEQDRLQKLRRERKSTKPVDLEEEELPQINLEDPSAKAWDKRIRDAAAPANQELEKAKEERRLFALRQFLSDKPSLSKNPEKLRAMMETYDRLKTSSELTSEGITMDLEKAYAAEHSEELIRAARDGRIESARNDAIMSDIGVSRGSSTYSNDKEERPVQLSEEERQILAKWGMTPAEWQATKKKYG